MPSTNHTQLYSATYGMLPVFPYFLFMALARVVNNFLAYSPSMKGHGILDNSESFATIGATIADNFNIKMPENTIGESVLDKLV